MLYKIFFIDINAGKSTPILMANCILFIVKYIYIYIKYIFRKICEKTTFIQKFDVGQCNNQIIVVQKVKEVIVTRIKYLVDNNIIETTGPVEDLNKIQFVNVNNTEQM